MLLLASGLVVACSRSPTRVPARLAVFSDNEVHTAQLAPEGNTLYWTFGEGAYAIDVTDPRHPRPYGTLAYADGLLCNIDNGCPGFFIRDSKAYFADDKYLAQITLPDGSPDWLYEFPTTSTQHYVVSMAPLPNGGFAVGGIRQDTVDTIPGDLMLVQMSNGIPSLAATILDTASTLEFMRTDGEKIFFLEDSGLVSSPPSVYHRIVAIDASDPTVPIEVARLDLSSVPVGDDIGFFAANSRDVIIGSNRSFVHDLDFLAWYRFAASGTTLSFVDATNRWLLGNSQPVVSGNHLFVTLYGTDADPLEPNSNRLAVLRLDTSLGLVEESITPLDGDVFPKEIAVDEDRGLVYVGGLGLEILDLGVLEGGPPRWP